MTLPDVIFDNWHPIAALDDVPLGKPATTSLLDTRITCQRMSDGSVRVAREGTDRALPVCERYGFVWTSLGTPAKDLFDIPEFSEPDRRNVSAGPIGVHVSAPRAIENFLDMGHFPFVHTGILGEEPHTEVKDYDVEVSEERDEVLATRCRFFQPQAALTATEGAEVDYVYRVPHPFCAVLYKSCPSDETRKDVIAVFVQPETEERIRAHLLLSMIDADNSRTAMRRFQQMIFGQDKPILENQMPKRLPLDPRAETPIRADMSAIAYRRWLSQKGVTYGVIAQVA
jgi:phenylpropionate dioxygenase-like ring-hydroxylating dioxygenase large terminal subunit